MIAKFSVSRAGAAFLGGSLLLLTACAEPEVILPGEREDIRGADAAAEVVNKSKPISLPKQVSNTSWATKLWHSGFPHQQCGDARGAAVDLVDTDWCRR